MQTAEVYFWLPPSLPVCMHIFSVSCSGALSSRSERLVVTELARVLQNDAIFYTVVSKRHMICLVAFFFLPSMPKPCALVTQARIRQNSMRVYKQPNAKFMSCGISCSVINYRRWFQVKKANCCPGSLLTLRDSLVIESNAVHHELQHEDKLDKSHQATLRFTRLGMLCGNIFTQVLERKKKKAKVICR